MKGKAVIPLVLGLCIGLVAVKFGIDAIKSAKAAGAAKKTVIAVRAARDINASELITKDMVQTVETTPNEFIPAKDRPKDLKEVVGRVAAKSIPQGAAVLKTMLAPKGTSPGMVGRIPPGFRAFTVKTNEITGVAYQVKPGDWVDVIVVMDVRGGGRNKETIAEVIMQHIKVGAVGRSLSQGSPDEKGGAGKGKAVRSTTLLIPEEDVPKLHLAASRGKLTLTLRGDDDILRNEPLFARSNEILESMKKPGPIATVASQPEPIKLAMLPPPEPEPEPPHALTVYHNSAGGGLRIERVTFENTFSRNVLDLSKGPVGRASSLMRTPSKASAVRPTARYDVADEDESQGKSSFEDWETE